MLRKKIRGILRQYFIYIIILFLIFNHNNAFAQTSTPAEIQTETFVLVSGPQIGIQLFTNEGIKIINLIQNPFTKASGTIKAGDGCLSKHFSGKLFEKNNHKRCGWGRVKRLDELSESLQKISNTIQFDIVSRERIESNKIAVRPDYTTAISGIESTLAILEDIRSDFENRANLIRKKAFKKLGEDLTCAINQENFLLDTITKIDQNLLSEESIGNVEFALEKSLKCKRKLFKGYIRNRL